MNSIRIYLIALCALCVSAVQTLGTPPENEAIAPYELNIKHTPVVYDSLIANWKSLTFDESTDDFTREYITLDSNYLQAISPFTDSQYKERLAALSCPIHLPYNNIIRDRLIAYTTTHKSFVLKTLAAAEYYFPIFEAELERQGLPLEFKFLPVIESGLTPGAVSRVGATGLWQFMLRTGKQYGLEITSLVDERRDPVAATRAACKMLKDLYKIYEDWTLVLASYNYGPSNVNKALRRAGEKAKTYWDIYPYLPRETRDYVPAFVAIVYTHNYHKDHHLYPSECPLPLATDTIMITRDMHFGQISETLDIPVEVLTQLNPQYKQQIIPAVAKAYPLILPQYEVTRFIEHEDSIFAKDSVYLAKYRQTGGDIVPERTSILSSGGATYKVRNGDTLGAIAKSHGVTVKQLVQWNDLTSAHKLRIGQVLTVRP